MKTTKIMLVIPTIAIFLFLVGVNSASAAVIIVDDDTGGGCSSVGTWTPATKTCTLTADVADSIQVDGNGIVLDGNGHAVSYPGINIVGGSGVTVKNVNVQGGSISLSSSNSEFPITNAIVEHNTVAGSIILRSTSNSNIIRDNTVFNEFTSGISVSSADNQILDNNISAPVGIGISIEEAGERIFGEPHRNIVVNNTFQALSRERGLSAFVYIYYGNDNQIYNNNFLGNFGLVVLGTGNIFNKPTPVGGNYWSRFDTGSEGCPDDGDFCGSAFVFQGGQDNLPWRVQNGWRTPREVPLYTQRPSPYPSSEDTTQWSQQIYAEGKGNIGDDRCGLTIERCGCAITSVVMVVRYYGVNKVFGVVDDVNPSTLNAWLNANLGYTGTGDLKWESIQEFTNDKVQFALRTDRRNDLGLLDGFLNDRQPVIAKAVAGRGGVNVSHFFVIDKTVGSSEYSVKDPFWYETTRLDSLASAGLVRDYENGFDGLRVYAGGIASPIDYISVNIASPAELLVMDSLGRRLGKDPVSGIEYDEIPGGSYAADSIGDPTGENSPSGHETKGIYILNPDSGGYTVEVIGMGTGGYTLESTLRDNQGASVSSVTEAFTAANLVSEYGLLFDENNASGSTIAPVDATPPVISHSFLNAQYNMGEAPVNFTYSATDDGIGLFSVSATLNGTPFTSGGQIPFTKAGVNIITITATDFNNNVATETATFNVVYQFSGFLQPIKTDGTGIYNLGRTLPIKFQLTDVNGNFVGTAIAQLLVAKISDGIVGTDEIPLSTSAADTGNMFRYDAQTNQYVYNLSTNTLTAGSWQLKALLDDGRDYTVIISIR